MSTFDRQSTNPGFLAMPAEQKDTTDRIYDLIHNFTVLARWEQPIFKHAIVIFSALYLIDVFQILLSLPHMLPHHDIKYDLTFTRNLLLIVVGISLITITFNFWRQYIPRLLQYPPHNSRLFALPGNANEYYFSLLENYHHNLHRRRKYALVISLIVITAIYYFGYVLIPARRDTLKLHHGDPVFMFSYSVHLLVVALILFGSIYCIGVVCWTVYTSGTFIRNLAQACTFDVEPLHPDQCGGLKPLGNFCFGLISPIFAGSLYFIGYIFVALRAVSGVFDPITVVFIIFIILVYAVPTSISAFFIPLWDIHLKMQYAGDAEDERYAVSLKLLRQKLQELFNDGDFEDAKEVKGKIDLMEASYMRYPQWPFNVSSKLFSTSLTTITSFGLGLLTALQGPLAKVILQLMGFKA